MPSFHGAPQPKHRPGEEERNAMLLMAYFRPFSLLADDDVDVPHVAHLKKDEETWAEAAASWLNGGLSCDESKRYVQNFMNVVDMRPVTEEDAPRHDDDLFSDEEM